MAKKPVLCIVGLGYVGLPLAHAFAKAGYRVLGYDVSERRVQELAAGHDHTHEISDAQLREITMTYTTDPTVIANADIIILAIPTPVDERNSPDLSLVESATRTVGKHLKKGAIVVYESTVYPGVTEEICGPILEAESHLRCGTDFTLGYSPERINPGDREHTVGRIVKVVAGQDEKTLEALAQLYGSIVKAGIHRAPSIKVAEMAKAIENAQRDINVAYINEIALLCGKLGIATRDVLAAAGTKWNFLKFQPGLVGGHCIGVDPYYLVACAKQFGMDTHIITAARAVNDGMSRVIAEQVLAALGPRAEGARMLVLGVTFKEDVPDTRNSKVRDVIAHLEDAGCDVFVHDAEHSPESIRRMGFSPGSLEDGPFDAVLYLVPHRAYRELPVSNFVKALRSGGVLYDLKSLLLAKDVQKAGCVHIAL